MTNEAAERLLDWLDKAFQEPPIRPISYRAFRPLVLDSIEGIKAAERRATVEFIEAEYQRSTISEHGTVIPDIAKVLAKALER